MGLLFRVRDAEGNPQLPRAQPRPEPARKAEPAKARARP